MIGPTVAALAAVCVGMRVTAPLLLGDRKPVRLERALTYAVPALLAALIVTGTFAEGGHVVLDARLAGVLVAAAVAAARGPLAAVVLSAVVATAVLRALEG